MRTTANPIYQQVRQRTYATQIQVQKEPNQAKRHTSNSGNWKLLPYATLQRIYGYFVWSKKKMLKDSSYANEREHFIVRDGWDPVRNAGADRAHVFKYHKYEKDLPTGMRLRILILEGNQKQVEIQERQGKDYKRTYDRIL